MNGNSSRTTGIILVILTVLLCACPGLVLLLTGGIFGLFGLIPEAGSDMIGSGDLSPFVVAGISICLGVFLVAIPIVIAVVTLRSKPSPTAPSVAPREPVSAPPAPPPVAEPPSPLVETAPPQTSVSPESEVVEPEVEETPAEPEQSPGEAPAEESPDEPEEDENYIPPAI